MATPATGWRLTFADRVAALTGLDPRTVLGWEQVEGGPADNPLNIGPGRHYGTTTAAASATGALLLTPLYADVELVAHRHYGAGERAKIDAEAQAIAASPWNDPNGAGSMTRQAYEQAIASDALDVGGGGGGGIGGAILGGVGDAVSSLPVVGPIAGAAGLIPGAAGALSGIASGVGSVVTAPVDFAKEVWAVLSAQSTWVRVGFFAGGLVLVVIALREAFA